MTVEPIPTETITIRVVTLGPPDEDGVPAETVTERDWSGCVVSPGKSTTEFGAHELVTARLRVTGPLAEWITPGCRARRDGVHYWLDGAPRHVLGDQARTELRLITWLGA